MIKLYGLMRKIHRVFVLIILALGLLLSVTGILLKFPRLSTQHWTFIDLGLVRYLHNNLSLYFTIVLFVMSLTGAWLYFYSLWLGRKRKPDSLNSSLKD